MPRARRRSSLPVSSTITSMSGVMNPLDTLFGVVIRRPSSRRALMLPSLDATYPRAYMRASGFDDVGANLFLDPSAHDRQLDAELGESGFGMQDSRLNQLRPNLRGTPPNRNSASSRPRSATATLEATRACHTPDRERASPAAPSRVGGSPPATPTLTPPIEQTESSHDEHQEYADDDDTEHHWLLCVPAAPS